MVYILYSMKMTDDEYNTRLQDLLDDAATLPPEQRRKLQPLIEETHALHALLTENRRRTEDVLSTWRLELKYFIFALEATAREQAQNKGRE